MDTNSETKQDGSGNWRTTRVRMGRREGEFKRCLKLKKLILVSFGAMLKLSSDILSLFTKPGIL